MYIFLSEYAHPYSLCGRSASFFAAAFEQALISSLSTSNSIGGGLNMSGRSASEAANMSRGPGGLYYDLKEVALESLLDLCRLPWLLLELFFNFDCHLESSSCFHKLFSVLCKCTFRCGCLLFTLLFTFRKYCVFVYYLIY